jgi:glycerol-3-phosphate dehydrogenase
MAVALERRRSDLEALAQESWDLVVVGGGIVGAGILLDAASRGLRAALVEQADIASGTSSRSSRLIHGGLRYLEQLRFGLVHEALDERSRLLRLAPHLVSLERFLVPIYGWPVLHRTFYGAGLALYDLLGSARQGARSAHLGVRDTLELAPPLRRAGLRGGIVYRDGVEDDARYTLAVVRTALAGGALAVTRARATSVLEEGGGVRGVRVRDELSGAELHVRTQRLVDATGVWGARPGGPFGGGSVRVQPSRGSHLLVPRARIPLQTGMTIRVPGRVVFLVPWPHVWIVGTTDEPDPTFSDPPTATAAEVDVLLEAVNRTLDVGLTRGDVVGTYAGLRPLVGDPGRTSTVKVSREHRVHVEPSGLVRIAGGKYTTYRVMARDAVDAALGPAARRRPSATAELPLVGAAEPADLERIASRLARETGLATDTTRSLARRHGTEAEAVAALGRRTGTLRPLGPSLDELEAEVVWAAQCELALSLEDVLARRMRLAERLRDRGEAIAPRAAELFGGELGWEATRTATEVESYLAAAHRQHDVPGPQPARQERSDTSSPSPIGTNGL